MVHDLERQERFSDAAGDDIAAKDGGKGGQGEQAALRAHGFNGAPHGVEEGILAQQVHDEVQGVGAVVVVELAAGPAEELEGRSGEGVGELEYVLDVGLCDAEAGVFEGLLDGGGVSGGDNPAEELHFGREVGGVKV